MALDITGRDVDGVRVLSLKGRVVFGDEATALRDEVKSLIDSGNKKVVLNMSNITFVDSAGLGALVSAHNVTRTNGGALRLCHLGPKIMHMLEMTNMHTVFLVSASETDAIRAFSK